MHITWMTVFADVPAADLAAATRFWSDVTGTTAQPSPTGSDELLPLGRDGEDTPIWLQRLDRGQARWHLDLMVDDRAGVVQLAQELGASTVRTTAEFTTLTSPSGLPFCLLAESRERRLPRPRQWPDGNRSLLDQVCIDIAADDFATEVRFWAGLTGWALDHGELAEFERLVRPDDVPLQILLQRLGADETGPTRAHVDFCADDRAAEQRRHEALGARTAYVSTHWTTLDDPVGLRYCITDRKPRRP
jgi:predicted enzyme related to lactoylglutathione lyase